MVICHVTPVKFPIGALPIFETASLAADKALDSLLFPFVISTNLALNVVASNPARFSASASKVGTSFKIEVTFSSTALSSGFSCEIISLYSSFACTTISAKFSLAFQPALFWIWLTSAIKGKYSLVKILFFRLILSYSTNISWVNSVVILNLFAWYNHSEDSFHSFLTSSNLFTFSDKSVDDKILFISFCNGTCSFIPSQVTADLIVCKFKAAKGWISFTFSLIFVFHADLISSTSIDARAAACIALSSSIITLISELEGISTTHSGFLESFFATSLYNFFCPSQSSLLIVLIPCWI